MRCFLFIFSLVSSPFAQGQSTPPRHRLPAPVAINDEVEIVEVSDEDEDEVEYNEVIDLDKNSKESLLIPSKQKLGKSRLKLKKQSKNKSKKNKEYFDRILSENYSTDNKLSVGEKTYEGSLFGIRTYVNSLKKGDRHQRRIYPRLNRSLSEIESRNTWSNIIGYGGLTLGLGYSVYSIQQDNNELGPFYTGLGVGFGSFLLAALFFKPSDYEKGQFIRQHNQLNPRDPAELTLEPKKAKPVALNIQFDY